MLFVCRPRARKTERDLDVLLVSVEVHRGVDAKAGNFRGDNRTKLRPGALRRCV